MGCDAVRLQEKEEERRLRRDEIQRQSQKKYFLQYEKIMFI